MADSKLLLGKLLSEKVKQLPITSSINEAEFSVYSQFGEDGILQFIIHHLKDAIKNKIFIEIGVQDYNEANTRFLLENNDWQGVIIDSNENDINKIQKSEFYWRNNLLAKKAFVTKDNINDLLVDLKLPEEIGILSIDIDGNDFWILKNINALKPAIIIVEYNSFFGSEYPISISYEENFCWRQSHPPSYFGASLPAFCHLLANKEYDLVGSNNAGNNAFFVRKEINIGKLSTLSCEKAYKKALFSQVDCISTNKFDEQMKTLNLQKVVNVINDKIFLIKTTESSKISITDYEMELV